MVLFLFALGVLATYTALTVVAAVRSVRWWRASRHERWDVLVGFAGLALASAVPLLVGDLVALRHPLLFRVPAALSYIPPACALVVAFRTILRRAEWTRAALRLRALVITLLAGGSAFGWLALHARDELGRWAQKLMSLPRGSVCAEVEARAGTGRPGGASGAGTDPEHDSQSCPIQSEAQPWLTWALQPTYVSMRAGSAGTRCVDLDWGGGFLAARGLLVCSSGGIPEDEDGLSRYDEVADGVFVYTTE